MIYIYMDGHDRMNDVQTAVQIFMPNEKYKPVDSVQDEGITVRSFLNGDSAVAELYENGAPVCSETAEVNEEGEGYALKDAVYNMLKKKKFIHTALGNDDRNKAG